MAYTTINKSTDYFNTKLYTGTGYSLNVTGVGFQPDFTWIKQRTGTTDHILTDAVRGVTKSLNSNDTSTDDTISNALTAFGTDGFTVGGNSATGAGSGSTYASWNWKANGQGSSNTAGSINTTYTSVNTTAGFSISSYTGNGTSGATVGHGLGVAPKMIMIKCLNTAHDWAVYHKSLTSNNYFLVLNEANQQASDTAKWQNTDPSSTVFTLGNGGGVNANTQTHVAYCFAEKTGYSKFDSYLGNNNENGPFIYTGFKPAFVMVKIINTQNDNWAMYDNKRNPFNLTTSQRFRANDTQADTASNSEVHFFSNGFKVHGSDGEINGSGAKYIYMAFAEAPLVGTNNIPATAR